MMISSIMMANATGTSLSQGGSGVMSEVAYGNELRKEKPCAARANRTFWSCSGLVCLAGASGGRLIGLVMLSVR